MTRRKNHFKFTEKKNSKKGIAALLLALIMAGLYVLFLYYGCKSGGKLSVYYGSGGIFALFGAFAALVMSLQSLKEENSFQFFPRLATFVSFLAFAGWGGTYALGFMEFLG